MKEENCNLLVSIDFSKKIILTEFIPDKNRIFVIFYLVIADLKK